MILIFKYTWGSEPCYGMDIFPVEYSSKDDLELDFEIACQEAIEHSKPLDFFTGQPLNAGDFMKRVVKDSKKSDKLTVEFIYEGPTIYTLDEWLQQETMYKTNSIVN